VDNVDLAAAKIHNHFLATPFVATGIDKTAVIGRDCRLAEDISIAAQVVLGNQVQIGSQVSLGAGAVIGDGVIIGDNCQIMANVVIYAGCLIGKQVIIHAGTVIGSAGYGYATDENGKHWHKPQVGRVRIDDLVEIGANCSIDCATFGETWIRTGAKLDNLVHLAHNVIIGENALITAQVGIAGSTILGKNVMLGGQAGVKDNLVIGDRVMAGGQCGITSDQPDDAILSGTPATKLQTWLRASTIFNKLPQMYRELRQLQKDVKKLMKNY
jgi:UDP-3-O-[3-hydroxymyristoyl] glucosamine N-acyltransferase